MIEKYLIEHCSPTLASLKTANLFVMVAPDRIELTQQMYRMNQQMREKGVSLVLLRYRNQKALIYVCRKCRLEADLSRPGVAEFLAGYGYTETTVRAAIRHLSDRLTEKEDFPHEIGIFLGYPLGDVIGFIENAGQNSKCSGCWKVYCNECEAIQLFAQFKKCRSEYMRLWNEGKSVMQLCVAERNAQRNVIAAAG